MIIELSSAVIACIVRDSSCLSEIELSVNDFPLPTHQEIYSAARQLESDNEPIDIISISDYLQKKTGKNWLKVVGELREVLVAVPNAAVYARKLKSRVKAKGIEEVALRIAEKAQSGETDIEAELGELMRVNVPDSKYEWTLKESLDSAIDLISDAMEQKGLVGIPTGLSEIDESIGGFQNTDLYIIGARPAMGKTSMLLNFAHQSNVPAGIISTEQGKAQVGQRFLAMQGSISAMRMRNAQLDEHEFSRMSAAVYVLQDKNIFINDKSIMTISELSRQARKWVFDYGIKILYVDYLQRIKADNLSIPKHEQVEQVVSGLKTLAKELNIPVVSLAQVNREVEKRPDKRPRMGDLKDSGAVEQEADVVMMLYRDWVYNNESNPSIAELAIEKNRHGATGIIHCTFEREFMRFTDMQYGATND